MGNVVVREYAVRVSAGKDFGPLRIAHISDLHFTRWNRTYAAVQGLLGGLDYDVLAVTGDFCDFRWRWRRTAGFCRRFFEPLAGNQRILAVLGNHDHPDLAEASSLPVEWLHNRAVTVGMGRGAVRFAGVNQCAAAAEDLSAALPPADPATPTVLMAHYPSTAFRLGNGSASLVLSGHTHGGQIRLPRVGCLWANDRIPRRMARGLHQVSGRYLHVSAGIGVSLPLRIRINCPAEISILTICAAPSPANARELPKSAIRALQGVSG